MAITTYSELKSAVASWLNRSDLTTQIPDFIALAEADLKVRAKLTQWDAEATVSLTSGAGQLPSGLDHIHSAVYGSQTRALQPISVAVYKDYAAYLGAGDPLYYTVLGNEIRVTPTVTGDVALTYTARFTSLSDTTTTNDLLTLFPDAYLYGALKHACAFLQDVEGLARYTPLFEEGIRNIRKYTWGRAYPQGLAMKVA